MNETYHAQNLGATQIQAGDGRTVLATQAVQEMAESSNEGAEALSGLLQDHAVLGAPKFLIRRQGNGSPEENIVARSFHSEIWPVAMTEAESLRHYGPHRAGRKRKSKRTIGWGIGQMARAMVWIVLIAALAVACHPEFVTGWMPEK